jgi:hypothetical protein
MADMTLDPGGLPHRADPPNTGRCPVTDPWRHWRCCLKTGLKPGTSSELNSYDWRGRRSVDAIQRLRFEHPVGACSPRARSASSAGANIRMLNQSPRLEGPLQVHQ